LTGRGTNGFQNEIDTAIHEIRSLQFRTM